MQAVLPFLRGMWRSCSLFLLVVGCTAGPAVPDSPAAGRTAYRLSVSPDIARDSSAAPYIAALRSMLTTRDSTDAHTCWEPEELERWGYPHSDLLGLEQGWNGPHTYLPTLIALPPTDVADQRMAHLAFMGADSSGNLQLKALYRLLATQHVDGVRFARAIHHHTAQWPRHTIGPITFINSPHRAFNMDTAWAAVHANAALAAFFGVEPMAFTYYACTDAAELFRVRGFDHLPNMYFSKTGAQHETWNRTIYAGNNSERYDHELVHGYTALRFGRTIHPLLDEGLSTALGGSNGLPYALHRARLGDHAEAESTFHFADHLDPAVRADLDDRTPIAYTVGALLCERALRMGGRDLLFRMLASGQDAEGLQRALALVQLHTDSLDAALRAELRRPRTPIRS